MSPASGISIVLATYNGARFLPELLASLAAQRVAPAELVVGDDGSTDGTCAIVHDFSARAPFPVRLAVNVTNLGYGDNFLATAARARGRFLSFCDQDDIWHPDKTAAVAEAFGRSPGTALVVHDYHRVDGHGNRIDRGGQIRAHHDIYPGFSISFSPVLLTAADPAQRPPGITGHDEWISLIGPCAGDPVVLPRPLVRYRQHGGNIFGESLRPAVATRARRPPDAGHCLARADTRRMKAAYLRDLAGRWAAEGPGDWSPRAWRLADHYDASAARDAHRAAILQAAGRRDGVAHWLGLYSSPRTWAQMRRVSTNWSLWSPWKELAHVLVRSPAERGVAPAPVAGGPA